MFYPCAHSRQLCWYKYRPSLNLASDVSSPTFMNATLQITFLCLGPCNICIFYQFFLLFLLVFTFKIILGKRKIIPLRKDRSVSSTHTVLSVARKLLGVTFWSQCSLVLNQHRMVWVEGTLQMSLLQSPCHGQGHLPLDQVAQSPIQPSLQQFQGGDSHSFFGQPVPGPHLPHSKKFLSHI